MEKRITQLFGIEYPVIQGGMHYVAVARLAAAVSNAGGLGIITALTQKSPEDLSTEIIKCKKMTDKPFGVNLTFLPTVPSPDYPGYIDAIIDGGVKVVETAGRNPEKYLPRLASGEWIGGYGQTEPGAGSDVAAMTTKAEKKGDCWVLNGSKTFITNAPIGNLFVVLATVDKSLGHKGITAFLVESTFEGFKAGRKLEKMGMRASPTGELIFEDCVVPEENVLGEVGQGFRVAMGTLVWERAAMIPALVGAAEARLEEAVRYAKNRVQFGQPIAAFQEIQHKLANMKMHLEISKTMFYKVAWMKSQGMPGTMEASLAKLFFSETNRMDALDAFQIHGGYGYMKEYPIERDVRDCIANTLGGGTSEVQRMIIARDVLKMYD